MFISRRVAPTVAFDFSAMAVEDARPVRREYVGRAHGTDGNDRAAEGSTDKEATMPKRTSYEHGTPNWVDLTSPDPAASKGFYGELFGWSWDDQVAPDGTFYSMASLGSEVVAGLGKLTDEMAAQGAPPTWNTYFATTDCDDTVKKAVAAGGSVVVEPFDIPEAGRMAYVVDDQGAHLGLWQAENHIGATVVTAPNAFSWAELMADDTAAAKAFYGATLGLGSSDSDMGDGNLYTMFTLGEDGVAGTLPPPMDEIPPHWHVYLGAADAAATAKKASELGGTVVMGPVDTPIGPMATIKDPQGAAFSIIQMNEWPE
jgi:predicted enzyme related to lactoylglutathione lyase